MPCSGSCRSRSSAGVLLVLDDMQWADEPTELLLRHLMRAQLHRLLVLATRRPPEPGKRDPLAKVVADLEREVTEQPRLVALSLSGLDVEATHALATARRDRPVDREFRRRLRAETAGNPFFIEQVLRGVREADLATDGSAARRCVRCGCLRRWRSSRIPRSQFSAEARELLSQAAACGPEFRIDALVVLRQTSTDSILQLLREPLAAGLILETSIGRYPFSHALVRETLYERKLTMTERAQLHLRIGEALEAGPSRQPPTRLSLRATSMLRAPRSEEPRKRSGTRWPQPTTPARRSPTRRTAATYTLNACDALRAWARSTTASADALRVSRLAVLAGRRSAAGPSPVLAGGRVPCARARRREPVRARRARIRRAFV